MKRLVFKNIVNISTPLFNHSLIALLLIIGLFQADQPLPANQYSKVIKKEINLPPDGEVSVSNKYGDIEVVGWDKNRVKIAVTILVNAAGELYAQRVFDRIGINFHASANSIEVYSNIQAPKKEWWEWGVEHEDDYTIGYKVYMPSTASLKVKNRHGNISLANISGKAELNVQHGDIHAGKLGREAILIVEDGYASLGQVGQLQAKVIRGHIRLDEVQRLEVNSSFSSLSLQKAEEMVCSTKYDTYTLERVGRFVNVGRFDDIEIEYAEEIDMRSRLTDLFVENVSKSLNLNVDSSSIEAEQLKRGFRQVELSGNFTDFRIGVPDNGKYQVDAITNYAGVRYPGYMIVVEEKDVGTAYKLQGHVGGKPDGASFIRARLKYGSLKLE
jgi:hypothetical protein